MNVQRRPRTGGGAGRARLHRPPVAARHVRTSRVARKDRMPQSILLIQSDAADAARVRESLTASVDGPFRVDWVKSCAEGLERLAREGMQEADGSGGISAILVDQFLPDSQGLETFDRLFAAAPQIPILVLSSPQDEETARQAVQR